MAHARRAEPAYYPQSAIYFVTAAVAAVLLTIIAAFAGFDPFGIRTSVDQRITTNPAVVESGRQWELQRLQQGGYVDPVMESGRKWELQRLQQSGDADPVMESGRQWELQRLQQSGGN